MPLRRAALPTHLTRAGAWLGLLSAAALSLVPCLSVAGETVRERGDPAVRLSTAPEATEYWDVTARFDDGYRLFARFGITNEGPGEHTAGAIWYLVHPDGRVSEFRNGRVDGRWRLSPDHLRIDVASSSLDLHAPVRRLALDSNTQRAEIALQFPVSDMPVWPPGPSAFRTDTLQMSAPIEGTIQVDRMPAPVVVRGTATLTHAWGDESIFTLVQRRIEFFATGPDLAVYLSDVTTPTGQHHRWLVVERNGTVDYQARDFELLLDHSSRATADGRFPVPEALLARDGRITLHVRPQRMLLRANALDVIPQPFRLLFSFKTDPRWVWADATFDLNLPAAATGASIDVSGQGILAVNFLNPLPLSK